jgi:trehalose utilization protein
MAIGLDKIQDITCGYGIFGRIFGFGNLIIESAGTYGKMVFEGMPNPKKIKWRIEKERSRLMVHSV